MVRIITDSAADFVPEELERMQVTCIPLTVIFGEQEYHENENLSKDWFYELLASSESFPKTSQASPRILLDLFEDAATHGDEAVYITLSSRLSGTYQNAVMVQLLVGSEKCFAADSRNGTGGPCIDTLEYLYRGGRISHTTYTLGTLANIKPITSVDQEGKVTVPAKTMGMRKGMAYLCKRLEARKPDEAHPLYVMYTNNRSVGQALAEKIRAMGIAVSEERIIQVGAAIGTHIGPEASGIVYVGDAE